jgi:hypothetical protein
MTRVLTKAADLIRWRTGKQTERVRKEFSVILKLPMILVTNKTQL